MLPQFIFTLLFSFITFPSVSGSIWCYSCVSTQPGCGDDGVNFFLQSAITCPKDDDMCVKIVERREGESRITRDCLSNLVTVKTNIPGDTFEGCRPAAPQPKLAVFVENNVDQFDLKRQYWTNTTYCFCQLDHWCNSAQHVTPTSLILIMPFLIYLIVTL